MSELSESELPRQARPQTKRASVRKQAPPPQTAPVRTAPLPEAPLPEAPEDGSEIIPPPADGDQQAPAAPGLRVFSDHPVTSDANDTLYLRDYADALYALINSRETPTPLTVSVSAPWGAGKSSMMTLTQNRLRASVPPRDTPHIVVEFNAWMHDGAESLSGALAAAVARQTNAHRTFWQRLRRPLPAPLLGPRERARRRQVTVLLCVLVAAAAAVPLSLVIQSDADTQARITAAFGSSVAATVALVSVMSTVANKLYAWLASLTAFVHAPNEAAAMGSMQDVSAQLNRLVRDARTGAARKWRGQLPNVVVVVDDLERCQPPKAVDVCEVAAQLLNHEGIVMVLVGDLRVIAASAELKYKAAADRFGEDAAARLEGWDDYGRFYLQKIVQFQLELPPAHPLRIERLARTAPVKGEVFTEPRPGVRRWVLRTLPFSPALIVAAVLAGLIVARGWTLLEVGLFVLTLLLGFVGLGFWLGPVNDAWVRVVGDVGAARRDLQRITESAAIELEQRLTAAAESGVEDMPSIDQLVNDVVRTAARGHAASYERLRRRVAAFYEDEAEGLVRARLNQVVSDSQAIRGDAERAAWPWLPSLPRTAKRLLNSVRFLLVVAVNRGVYPSPVSAEQLGRWAVLQERWPKVVTAIELDPALIGRLEADGVAALPKGVQVEDATKLGEFFREGPPMADVAELLVYLDDGADRATPAPAEALPASNA